MRATSTALARWRVRTVAPAVDEPGVPAGLTPGQPPQRRRKRTATGIVVVVMAAGVVVGVFGSFHGGPAATGGNPYPTLYGTVTEGPLVSQTSVSATLGYAGSYTVVNQAHGTYTQLPAVGRVIEQGRVLYRVGGTAVVLLYGPVPVYRPLSEGMTGPDVRQLNHALVALGYVTRAHLHTTSGYFSARTATALKKLQAHLGLAQTGTLGMGQAVFLPSAARITAVQGTLGGPAAPGGQLFTASSTTRQVTIALDAVEQSYVKVGDTVSVTLPDRSTTPGVVSSVGTVATPGSSGSSATITVHVRLLHPAAAGLLDEAPVEVSITTGRAGNALAVPVSALLAKSNGGYEIQVVGPGKPRLIPVTPGLFDDSAGLVQVTGAGLRPGQKVVEAQS